MAQAAWQGGNSPDLFCVGRFEENYRAVDLYPSDREEPTTRTLTPASPPSKAPASMSHFERSFEAGWVEQAEPHGARGPAQLHRADRGPAGPHGRRPAVPHLRHEDAPGGQLLRLRRLRLHQRLQLIADRPKRTFPAQEGADFYRRPPERYLSVHPTRCIRRRWRSRAR